MISISKTNVTNAALGYTPPTTDTGTHCQPRRLTLGGVKIVEKHYGEFRHD